MPTFATTGSPSSRLIAVAALLVSGSCALAQGSLTIVYVDPPDIGAFFGPPRLIDVNGDGLVDFVFESNQRSFRVLPEGQNAVIARQNPLPDRSSYATPLLPGIEIGSLPPTGLNWVPTEFVGGGYIGPTFTACTTEGCLGDFTGLDAFLGVRFQASDGLLYGWMRVSVPFAGVNGGWIHEWAYETRPDTPILAGAVPEPSTWALLIGGSVLMVWFRRKGMKGGANKITGPNAGGPRRFPIRTPLAARVGQF
jgi:hypothetical protein